MIPIQTRQNSESAVWQQSRHSARNEPERRRKSSQKENSPQINTFIHSSFYFFPDAHPNENCQAKEILAKLLINS